MKSEKPQKTLDTPHSNSGRYGGHGYKKGGRKNIVPTGDNDYFRSLGFKIGRDGPNMRKQ